MTPAQLAIFQRLGRDPETRAAIEAFLKEHKEQWEGAVASPKVASNHGTLAHAAGALAAVRVFSDDFRAHMEPPAKARKPREAEDEP